MYKFIPQKKFYFVMLHQSNACAGSLENWQIYEASAAILLGARVMPSLSALLRLCISMRGSCLVVACVNLNGIHGGHYKIADIGHAELTEDPGASAKGIPPRLLPDSCLERADTYPANRSSAGNTHVQYSSTIFTQLQA